MELTPELATAAVGALSVVITAIVAPFVAARLRGKREDAEVEAQRIENTERLQSAAIALVKPLEEQISSLSGEINKLKLDNGELRERVSALEARLRQAAAYESELQRQLAASRASEAALTERVRELERQNEELRKRLDAAHAQIEQLKRRIGEVEHGSNAQ